MDSPVVRQRMRTTYTGVMELEDVAGRNGSGLESSEHQEQWSCSNSHARADKRSKGDKVEATKWERRKCSEGAIPAGNGLRRQG